MTQRFRVRLVDGTEDGRPMPALEEKEELAKVNEVPAAGGGHGRPAKVIRQPPEGD